MSFSYNGEPALSRVYFKIFPLDLVSLIGPNGGGKTTLFRLLLGLLRPGHGTIRIFGQPPDRARTRVGYVPQYARFDPRFPISVRDVVTMGRQRTRFLRDILLDEGVKALTGKRPWRLWRRSGWPSWAAGLLPTFPAASGNGCS